MTPCIGLLDEIRPGAISSGWHRIQPTSFHTDDLWKLRMSSEWLNSLAISHPDEILLIASLCGWLNDSHPADLKIKLFLLSGQCRKSSGWDTTRSYLIRMTKGSTYVMSSGWLVEASYVIQMTQCIGHKSSGWDTANSLVIRMTKVSNFLTSSGLYNLSWNLCHPDEIAPGRTSSGRLMCNAGCYPDDLRY